MPIDPSIPLSGRPPQLANPLELMSQVLTLRTQQENAGALREQREALADERRQIAEKRRRDLADQAAIGQAYSGATRTRQSVIESLSGTAPRLIPDVEKLFDEADKRAADLHSARIGIAEKEKNYLGSLAAGVKAQGYTSDALHAALSHAVELFPDYQETAGKIWQSVQQQPESLKAIVDGILAESPAQAALQPKNTPQVIAPGSALVDDAGKELYKAPEKLQKPASAQEYEYAVAKGYKGSFEQYQNEDANRRRSVVTVNAGNASDVKDAVTGMREGTIPPQLPGRASKEYVAIMAEAHRQGYDLATAATDWSATQKHIATMNGAQQLRLNQAINALPEMLDKVDSLASQWKGGRFPILNKANLIAAKNGLFGPQVASVATQLGTQIADVTADLGNVYMGGNSPTDHALGLAAKSLGEDWDEKVLHDMVKLAKANVTIRRNSIRNTGVAGASEKNPYAPPPQPETPPPAIPGLSYADYLKRKKGGG
jgi:hypothetical protein